MTNTLEQIIKTGQDRLQLFLKYGASMNTNVVEKSTKDFEILFVDDDKDILTTVAEYLSLNGYCVTSVSSSLEALDLIKSRNFDIIFTDLKMPEVDGLELLAVSKEFQPQTEVIIITGYGTVDSAIESLKMGSYDYLQKPIKLERLGMLVERIRDKKQLEKENPVIKKRLKERYRFDDLVGVSTEMQGIYEKIERMSSTSPTVLIQGESGTGKEVVARVIHQNSDRREEPFIPVNCGALVEGLQESELFGHLKGAFTGAIKDRVGLFEAAAGGTIFLDEIAKSPPSLQVKFLRVLQEKRIRPVGGTRELDIDVRIIAATNKDPEEAMKLKTLRKDLYYRLNVISIRIPPLRERKEDIPLLVNHFLEKFNARSEGKVIQSVSPEAMDVLIEYQWPGNVRQLENVIERAFVLGLDKTINIADLPYEIMNSTRVADIKENNYNLRENEIALIKKALRKVRGKKADAARLLGINTSTLYRKLKSYHITNIDLQNAN